MLNSSTSPSTKRRRLRERLARPEILVLPGAFNPLSALLIEQKGFEGVYLSGAVIAADLGLPDIGLTSVSEVAARAAQVARVTSLPTIVDADTGFGEPLNVARSIQLLEDTGVAGAHLEDQINPKRCGHLDGKQLVDLETSLRRVRAAIAARRDPDFLVVARTDARSVEGLDAAIIRARAYVDAGADAIFPEALLDEREFAALRSAVTVPIVANMTEFGKGALLRAGQLEDLGIDAVIFRCRYFDWPWPRPTALWHNFVIRVHSRRSSPRCKRARASTTLSTINPTHCSTSPSSTSILGRIGPGTMADDLLLRLSVTDAAARPKLRFSCLFRAEASTLNSERRRARSLRVRGGFPYPQNCDEFE